MSQPLEVIWLLKAEVDFQETYNRIERYSEERAEKFFDSVNSALEVVASNPEAGSPYSLPIRRVLALKGRYGVFYRCEPCGIVVLGIEDLRQDPRLIRRMFGLDE